MVTGTVRDIAYRAQYAGLANPAIIVVGEVVKLSETIRQVHSIQNTTVSIYDKQMVRPRYSLLH